MTFPVPARATAALMFFASMGLTAPAAAQQKGLTGTIGGGAVLVPEFEGSDDRVVRPLPLARLRKDGRLIELQGLTLRAELVGSGPLTLGPLVQGRLPRNDDVEDEVVARLREIDWAVEVGGFARARLVDGGGSGPSLDLIVDAAHDVADAHGGWVAGAGLNATVPLHRAIFLSLDGRATWASADYQQSYFGVDADNALRSGLPFFEADAGLKDVGGGVGLTAFVSPRVGLTGRLGYARLLGDAADSPIVRERGSEDQLTASLALLFRF